MVALIENNTASTRRFTPAPGNESIGWDTPAATAPARRGRPARITRPVNLHNDKRCNDPLRWADTKAVLTRHRKGEPVAHDLDKLCAMLESVAVWEPVMHAAMCAGAGVPEGKRVIDFPVRLVATALHTYVTASPATRRGMYARYEAWCQANRT